MYITHPQTTKYGASLYSVANMSNVFLFVCQNVNFSQMDCDTK